MIGVGVIGALLVGQVITGGDLTLLIILLGVFVPMVGFLTWAESWIAHDLAYRLLAEMRVDMYDSRSQISEDHRYCGACDVLSEIDDIDALQRQLVGVFHDDNPR